MAYGAAADGGWRKSKRAAAGRGEGNSLPPRRGQIKVKILGMLFKSVVAMASAPARRGEGSRTTSWFQLADGTMVLVLPC
ncbi:unnamed protein product [Spirodela intermedia]|uniref:Uncharacterized protein n=1 Tax=Spirodela intermedia TaxID=51605 RepID=A0ABN7ECM3_SPIIN|nr:unnamed protein product [Spirodela intermedia]